MVTGHIIEQIENDENSHIPHWWDCKLVYLHLEKCLEIFSIGQHMNEL